MKMKLESTFEVEASLVAQLETKLSEPGNPFELLRSALEFNYLSGKVDIVGHTREGDLVAFEAKIDRWSDALHQAYRNSAFAHYSYVVLPEANAGNALKAEHEFERRGVGLCSFGNSGIKIEIPASKKEPLQPWLTNSALTFINRQV
jgi:hypothetical protein